MLRLQKDMQLASLEGRTGLPQETDVLKKSIMFSCRAAHCSNSFNSILPSLFWSAASNAASAITSTSSIWQQLFREPHFTLKNNAPWVYAMLPSRLSMDRLPQRNDPTDRSSNPETSPVFKNKWKSHKSDRFNWQAWYVTCFWIRLDSTNHYYPNQMLYTQMSIFVQNKNDQNDSHSLKTNFDFIASCTGTKNVECTQQFAGIDRFWIVQIKILENCVYIHWFP